MQIVFLKEENNLKTVKVSFLTVTAVLNNTVERVINK